MPFKSEKQRRYLWANEPEIARDWTDTYGSRIKKDDGGIMRVGLRSGTSGAPGGGDPGMHSTKASDRGPRDDPDRHGPVSKPVHHPGPDRTITPTHVKPGRKPETVRDQKKTITDRIREDTIRRNKVAAMRQMNLMGKGLPGFWGQMISSLKDPVPDWAEDLTAEKLMDISVTGPYLSQQKTKRDAAQLGLGKNLMGRVGEAQTLVDEGLFTQAEHDRLFPGPGGPPDRDQLPYYPRDVHPGTGGSTTPSTGPTTISEFQESLKDTGDATSPGYYVGEDPAASNIAWGKAYGVDPRTMGMTSFAAHGGRIPAAFGGIMDSSTGRRAYGLGSIFKSIKKAAKKVFKSPIGKAALIGGLGYLMTPGTAGMFNPAGKGAWWQKLMMGTPGTKDTTGIFQGPMRKWSDKAFTGTRSKMEGSPLQMTKGGTKWTEYFPGFKSAPAGYEKTIPGREPTKGFLKKVFGGGKGALESGWNPWKIGLGVATAAPFLMGDRGKKDDKKFDYEGAKKAYSDEIMRIKRGVSAGSLDPNQWSYLPSDYTFTGAKDGGRIGYYAGGQSIPSDYTMEDAMMTTTQDKLGGITDVMKQADLSRQGSVGQFYAAHGGSPNNDKLMARVKELQDEGLDFNSAMAQAMKELSSGKADGGRIGLKKGTRKESLSDKLTRWAGGPSMVAGDLGFEGLHQIYNLLGMGGLYAQGGRIGYAGGSGNPPITTGQIPQAPGQAPGPQAPQRPNPMPAPQPNRMRGMNPMMGGMPGGMNPMGRGMNPIMNRPMMRGMPRRMAQEGGLMDLGGMEKDYRNDGGFVPLGGEEKADDVPARLSKNEFVFTADAVRGAGDGDIDKGAEIMENIMKNLEQGGQISEETQGLAGAQEMFGVSERLSEVV